MGGKCSWCLRRTSVSVFRSAGAVTIPCRQTQKDRRNVNTVSKCSWLFLSFSPFLFPSSSLSHTRSHSGYVWVDMPAWVDGSYFYESLVLLQMLFFSCKKILYYYESVLRPVRIFNRLSVLQWGSLLLSTYGLKSGFHTLYSLYNAAHHWLGSYSYYCNW